MKERTLRALTLLQLVEGGGYTLLTERQGSPGVSGQAPPLGEDFRQARTIRSTSLVTALLNELSAQRNVERFWAPIDCGVAPAVGVQTIRERLALPEFRGRGGCLYGLGLITCLVLTLVIGARYFIRDADGNVAAMPYRLLEWGVVDRIGGPVSDECLANRVLEYGDYHNNGSKARDELYARKESAVPGVVARLDQLADEWPPKPHTVTDNGIAMLLNFLKQQGEVDAVRRWERIPFNQDMQHIEQSSGFWY